MNTATLSNKPTRPYVVQNQAFGPTGNQLIHPVKVYPSGMTGLILTTDERCMEVYVEWLEKQVEMLTLSVREMGEKVREPITVSMAKEDIETDVSAKILAESNGGGVQKPKRRV